MRTPKPKGPRPHDPPGTQAASLHAYPVGSPHPEPERFRRNFVAGIINVSVMGSAGPTVYCPCNEEGRGKQEAPSSRLESHRTETCRGLAASWLRSEKRFGEGCWERGRPSRPKKQGKDTASIGLLAKVSIAPVGNVLEQTANLQAEGPMNNSTGGGDLTSMPRRHPPFPFKPHRYHPSASPAPPQLPGGASPRGIGPRWEAHSHP